MTSSTSFFISSVSSEARETDRGQEEKTLTGQHTGTLPAEQSTWHIYRKAPRAHQKETGTGGIVCPCFSCHHSICHSLHKTCNKSNNPAPDFGEDGLHFFLTLSFHAGTRFPPRPIRILLLIFPQDYCRQVLLFRHREQAPSLHGNPEQTVPHT